MGASAPNRNKMLDGTNFHTWKATLKRKSRKALAMICLAMEDSQLLLVRLASGVHGSWSQLEEHFKKKSLANKLFLTLLYGQDGRRR
uniref:Uncharacterized protein n=1 Tax=Hyaloperonospora arabidopsidis (strain Emoy2) TaxID=559515 RepID=M4BSM1_HYAAE